MISAEVAVEEIAEVKWDRARNVLEAGEQRNSNQWKRNSDAPDTESRELAATVAVDIRALADLDLHSTWRDGPPAEEWDGRSGNKKIR